MEYNARDDAGRSYDDAIEAMRGKVEALKAAGAKRVQFIGNALMIQGDASEVLRGIWSYLSLDEVVVLSDVPYGIDYRSGHRTQTLWGAADSIRSDNDTSVRDDVVELFPDCVPQLIFGSWRAPRPAATRQVLIWDKGGALGMGALDIPWKPDHEEIYVIGKGFEGVRDCGSVVRHPPVQSMAKNGRVHPTQKPVGLIRQLLQKMRCGPVIDPFMGSGTTGVAAIQLGRKFIGIELDKDYFEIACARVTEAWNQPRLFDEPKPAKPVNGNLFDGDAA